jgi:signal transduction histidine kinase/ligand-binding sensor domain-containing protein/DNA-binding response OmpR family regulator
VGTLEGLAYFDGHAFTTFRAAEIEGLPGNRINALLQASDGTLWVGTPNGLSMRRNRNFRRIDGPAVVRSLVEGPKGTIWIGTKQGLYRSTTDGDRIEPVPLPAPHAQATIRDVAVAGPQAVWFRNQGRLYRYREGRVEQPVPITRRFGEVSRIDRTSDGAVWVDAGSQILRIEDGIDTSYAHGDVNVQKIRRSAAGSPIIATLDRGLLRWTDGEFRRINPEETVPDRLMDLVQDESGQWWVGTYNQGLVRLRRSLFRQFDDPSLGNSAIHGVRADDRGTVWAGTFSNGLLRRSENGVRQWSTADELPSSPTVWTIARDASGTPWIATDSELLRRENGTFKRVRTPEGAPFQKTVALYRDPSGTLWIPRHKGSLYRYRADSLTQVLSPDRLSSRVLALHRTETGSLWIGTRSRGVAQYRNDSLRWYGPDDGVPYPTVRDVHETKDGTLWIATYGGGVARYEGDHFAPVSPEDGLPDGTIHAIHEAPEGVFWMTSNVGVFRVPRSQLKAVADGRRDRVYVRHFGRRHGMPVRECNGNFQPALAEDPSGHLWIPTMDGLTTIDPTAASISAPESLPLRITEVRVDGQSRSPDTLSLAPSAQRLVIDFSAVSLRRADDLYFRYRIDDGSWTSARGRRTAEHTNLEAGDHQFEVQATLDGETWYSLRAPFGFTVAPHFYETGWFRGLVVLFVLGLLGGGYLLRVRALRRREEELRRMVNERTAELAEEKKKTEEQARRLEALNAEKNRFFANVSHELRTPLTLILGPLRDVLEGTHGPVSSSLQTALQRMQHSALRLQALIDQLLDLSTLETTGLELDRKRADLLPFLERLVDAFVPHAERNDLTLQFRPRVEAQALDFDPERLEKVFANLLSNAIEFTSEGGSVLVTVEVNDGSPPTITVAVHDTGPGIPSNEQDQLFDRFYQTDDTGANEGVGIGLALASEVVELHGGTLDVTSRAGEGSTFTVSLPLPDDISLGAAPSDGSEPALSVLQEDGAALHPAFSPPAQPEPLPSSPSEESPSDAPVLLIVEDNAHVRAHLRRHLQEDHRLVEAANGTSGLEAAREQEPDLVLLDLMLPEHDGIDVCRTLRADDTLGGVPVIMLTARASEEDTAQGLDAGADVYLTKPFSMTTLQGYIGRLLDARTTSRTQVEADVLAPDVDPTSEDEAFLEQVADSIETHLGRSSFTVDDLAADVGLSPRQLRRRLKELTGHPPSEVVRIYRLRYAAQLLAAETGTVSQIAYRVGFGTPDTFSKHFEEHFGCCPSDYAAQAPSGASSSPSNPLCPPERPDWADPDE